MPSAGAVPRLCDAYRWASGCDTVRVLPGTALHPPAAGSTGSVRASGAAGVGSRRTRRVIRTVVAGGTAALHTVAEKATGRAPPGRPGRARAPAGGAGSAGRAEGRAGRRRARSRTRRAVRPGRPGGGGADVQLARARRDGDAQDRPVEHDEERTAGRRQQRLPALAEGRAWFLSCERAPHGGSTARPTGPCARCCRRRCPPTSPSGQSASDDTGGVTQGRLTPRGAPGGLNSPAKTGSARARATSSAETWLR